VLPPLPHRTGPRTRLILLAPGNLLLMTVRCSVTHARGGHVHGAESIAHPAVDDRTEPYAPRTWRQILPTVCRWLIQQLPLAVNPTPVCFIERE
jgi:hypothetical protein